MYPAPVGLTAVTFSATADAPVGTPPWPVIWTETVPSAGTGPGVPFAVRVSRIRLGDRDLNAPGAPAAPPRK